MFNKLSKNLTVAIAMSGGVDSSVAAALLKKQGHQVRGFFMKNWSETAGLKHADCPWLQDREDAMRVAAKLDIPFTTLDFEKEYKDQVLDYFFKEYKSGRTPNPDVMCNAKIKFGVLLDKAIEQGVDYLATGHYARLRREDTRYKIQDTNKFQIPNKSQLSAPYSFPEGGVYTGSVVSCQLLKAMDKEKDQTYFLHRLNQKQLSRAMFPIGNFTKPQVRQMGKKFGLPNHDKRDSQGVCFMGHIDLRKFLSQKIKDRPGSIITKDGKIIGRHQGLHIYTIGQRQGIGIGGTGPFYVVEKDCKNNQLVVTDNARDKALYKSVIEFADVSWISGSAPNLPLTCQARIRYRESLSACVVSRTTPTPPQRGGDNANDTRSSAPLLSKEGCRGGYALLSTPEAGRQEGTGGGYKAKFKTAQWAVASGQSIVFYDKLVCLGGGIIV